METAEMQLASERQTLAGLNQAKHSLENERTALSSSKQDLARRAHLRNEADAKKQLKANDRRMLEIGQELENVTIAIEAQAQCVGEAEKALEQARRQAAAAEGVALAREQIKHAEAFEAHLDKAAQSLLAIKGISHEVAMKMREVDPGAAFTSKTMAGRVEERLTHYFKVFGARELVSYRDTPLPDQFQAALDFFETNQ